MPRQLEKKVAFVASRVMNNFSFQLLGFGDSSFPMKYSPHCGRLTFQLSFPIGSATLTISPPPHGKSESNFYFIWRQNCAKLRCNIRAPCP